MTARNFLVRGLLIGLLAGFASFLVAHQVGEPHVERAIALEEANAAAADEPTHADEHADEGTSVSRPHQRTWGLLTGTLAVGLAVGGLVALVAAGTVGRLGRLSPGQSTAVVSLVGFVAVALVPFLKYPATPPAVGSGDTIGDRTSWFFGFVLISVAVAALASLLAVRLAADVSTYVGVVSGAGLYLVVMVAAGLLMPTVNEVGDFPADELWFFRRASLLTLVALWGVIGVGLTGLVARLHGQTSAVRARRELAASL
ncbi:MULTISPECIES: CbtA family protein [unclassified Nocardioides]|uniref:CbtA family protein n=1 Tax=unclassified Nocardioides TaxID=2615069 RepID=UPI003014CC14